MLQLKNITKKYKVGREVETILNDISFNIKKGEFIALVGPSGCGKSTMLNLLGGLDHDIEGEVIFDGKSTKEFKEKDWDSFRKKHVGTIFQSFNLIPHMNALENVEIAMSLSAISKSERREKAENLLKLVGLENRMKYKPNQLSGGQKQRVAIARALANDPDIILADEPTGALDSKTAIEIMNLLKDINEKQGKTILIVTHAEELAKYASREISMLDGRILEDKVIKKNEDIIKDNKIKEDKSKVKSMGIGASIKLSLKNMRQKIWRNILIVFGASIGICGLALILGIGSGAQTKVGDEVNKIIDSTIIYVSKENSSLKDEDLEKIKEVDGVSNVLVDYMFLGNMDTKDFGLVQLAIQSGKDVKNISTEEQAKILSGNWYSSDDEESIVIPEQIVEMLYGKETKKEDVVGKEITVKLQSYSQTDVGSEVEKNFKICGVSEGSALGSVCSIPPITATKIADESLGDKEVIIGSVKAYLKDGEDIKTVQNNIEKEGYVAQTSEDTIEQINYYIKIISICLGLFALITLVVSTIMIGIVLYISVLERIREIGILRAIGARRKDIRRTFLVEAGLIGFFSAVLGIIGSTLWGLGINSLLGSTLTEEAFKLYETKPTILLGCIGLSVVVSIIAGFIPSFKASRLDPVEALRHE